MATYRTTTNNLFRTPSGAVGEAPDGPGGMATLADDIDALIQQGNWYPTIGGSAAAPGANFAQNGKYFRVGKHISAKGRIVFGSSATWGTGTPVIAGMPIPSGGMDQNLSNGYGTFQGIPVILTPVDATYMSIRVMQSAGAAAGTNTNLGTAAAQSLGTPPQSSILRVTLDITLL